MSILTPGDLTPVSVSRYHNKHDVCRFFRISRSTLDRWIRNGDFPPPRKVGQIVVGWPPGLIRRVNRQLAS